VAFVHPNPELQAAEVSQQYGLSDVSRFSDPPGHLYQAFGLGRARIIDFLKPGIFKRYWQAWRAGHSVSKPTGDVRLMPGVFLLHEGQIRRAFRHPTPADRPDYVELARPVDMS
jgi:hypothetical protein